jgi:hypothetical protein
MIGLFRADDLSLQDVTEAWNPEMESAVGPALLRPVLQNVPFFKKRIPDSVKHWAQHHSWPPRPLHRQAVIQTIVIWPSAGPYRMPLGNVQFYYSLLGRKRIKLYQSSNLS